MTSPSDSTYRSTVIQRILDSEARRLLEEADGDPVSTATGTDDGAPDRLRDQPAFAL
jgi:hypothetical protein